MSEPTTDDLIAQLETAQPQAAAAPASVELSTDDLIAGIESTHALAGGTVHGGAIIDPVDTRSGFEQFLDYPKAALAGIDAGADRILGGAMGAYGASRERKAEFERQMRAFSDAQLGPPRLEAPVEASPIRLAGEERAAQAGRTLAEVRDDLVDKPEGIGWLNPVRVPAYVAQEVTQGAPALLATIASGPLAPVTMGGIAGASKYADARDAKVDPQKALSAAQASAAVGTLTGAAPVSRALDPETATMLRRALETGAGMSVANTTNKLADIPIRTQIEGQPAPDFGTVLKSILEGLPVDFASGAGFGALHHPTEAPRAPEPPPDYAAALRGALHTDAPRGEPTAPLDAARIAPPEQPPVAPWNDPRIAGASTVPTRPQVNPERIAGPPVAPKGMAEQSPTLRSLENVPPPEPHVVAPTTPAANEPVARPPEPVSAPAQDPRATANPRENPQAFGLPAPKVARNLKSKPEHFDPNYDDALDFLTLNGGLDRNEWMPKGVDPAALRNKGAGVDKESQETNRRFGARGKALFPKEGGMSIDQARERLQRAGFLETDGEGSPHVGDDEALQLVMSSINQGERHLLPPGREVADQISAIEREQADTHRDTQTAAELNMTPEELRRHLEQQTPDERASALENDYLTAVNPNHVRDENTPRATDGAAPKLEDAMGADLSKLSDAELRRLAPVLQKGIVTGFVGGRPIEGVMNLAGYEQVRRAGGSHEHIAFIDGDSFKAINELGGHDLGDSVIHGLAKAVHDNRGDGNAVWRSGDEFFLDGKDPAALAENVRKAQEDFGKMTFEYDGPNGEKSHVTGLSFSFGVGRDAKSAELAHHADKDAKLATGQRRRRAGDDGGPIPGKPAAQAEVVSTGVVRLAAEPVTNAQPSAPAGLRTPSLPAGTDVATAAPEPAKPPAPAREAPAAGTGAGRPNVPAKGAEGEQAPTAEGKIGISNELTNESRAQRELAPLISSASETDREGWDAAGHRAAVDPNHGRRLAAELAANPRPTTQAETFDLLHEAVRLTDEHDAARAEAARTEGKSEGQIAADLIRLKDIEMQFAQNDKALRGAGTESGAAFRVRKLVSDLNYSVPKVIERLKIASGEDVPAAQRAEIEALKAKIDEGNAEIARLNAEKAKPATPKKPLNERAQERLRSEIAKLEGQIKQRKAACPI